MLKWGLVAPFIFSVKFNSNGWIPWLLLYGKGQSGKSTLGEIILRVWNLDKREKSVGFNSIDTVARFGHIISKDTFPVLVNEVGSLSTNSHGKYFLSSKSIKNSIENVNCRSKFIEGKYFVEIPALSPMLLTSNYSPPNDGSFNRRFISINFPDDEKKEIEQQLKFEKIFDHLKNSLSVLGDFAATYMLDNPSKLIGSNWQTVAKDIPEGFYNFGGKDMPYWFDYFGEKRDAIDKSSERSLFDLRAFLIEKINIAYVQNKRLDDNYADHSIDSKLNLCLKYQLIPFLS